MVIHDISILSTGTRPGTAEGPPNGKHFPGITFRDSTTFGATSAAVFEENQE